VGKVNNVVMTRPRRQHAIPSSVFRILGHGVGPGRAATGASAAAVVLLALVLVACDTAATRVSRAEKEAAFPFIQTGVTTKADFDRRGFGRPSVTYEQGRIWVVAVGPDDFGYWRFGGPYDLVLVFDSKGVLQRHGLVLARSEP